MYSKCSKGALRWDDLLAFSLVLFGGGKGGLGDKSCAFECKCECERGKRDWFWILLVYW